MFGHATLDPTFFGYPASTVPWRLLFAKFMSLGIIAGTCIYIARRKGVRVAWRAAIPMLGGWLFGELLVPWML